MVPLCITTPNIVKVLVSHHFVFPDFVESFKESKAQLLAWLYASPSGRGRYEYAAKCKSHILSCLRAKSFKCVGTSTTLELCKQLRKEGVEQLEEPNQVSYTKKDFVSTISYNSKKNNDSKESIIVGYGVYSALQKMIHMEASLSKLYRHFPDCSVMNVGLKPCQEVPARPTKPRLLPSTKYGSSKLHKCKSFLD
ncbi:hypothetical protein Fmac_028805 [Flemingia macrophylla]|uniref:Uncharacterized protein n=1 Tax=Flemingia macrophylla TaxID=520843 RepID=A0ABD1L8N0_9FABA